MATKKKTTAHAAQVPAGTPGPAPAGPQTHRWTTVDEYAAQVSMPCHRLNPKVLFNEDGTDPHYETKCGIVLGSVLLRTTDDAKDVTCPDCKRSRKR